jgi:hypothetical protein
MTAEIEPDHEWTISAATSLGPTSEKSLRHLREYTDGFRRLNGERRKSTPNDFTKDHRIK